MLLVCCWASVAGSYFLFRAISLLVWLACLSHGMDPHSEHVLRKDVMLFLANAEAIMAYGTRLFGRVSPRRTVPSCLHRAFPAVSFLLPSIIMPLFYEPTFQEGDKIVIRKSASESIRQSPGGIVTKVCNVYIYFKEEKTGLSRRVAKKNAKIVVDKTKADEKKINEQLDAIAAAIVMLHLDNTGNPETKDWGELLNQKIEATWLDNVMSPVKKRAAGKKKKRSARRGGAGTALLGLFD